MEVDGAKLGRIPHHLGQHAKRNHNEHIRFPGGKRFIEFGIFQVGRLQQREAVCFRSGFDGRRLDFLAPSGPPIRSRDNTDYIVGGCDQRIEAYSCKFWRSEESDTERTVQCRCGENSHYSVL